MAPATIHLLSWPKGLGPCLPLACILWCGSLMTGCDQSSKPADERRLTELSRGAGRLEVDLRQEPAAASSPIVIAARAQIGLTRIYDPSYVRLDYPRGDVPLERGVCTDVVVRALRRALDVDLQQLVHEDMKSAFSQYPRIWGLKTPDRNIDHRRVPNLQCYFHRRRWSIPVTAEGQDYLPGDVVTCTVPPNRPHMMIVSDRITRHGLPFVIHNIGRGTTEEDRLFAFPLTGHYRIRPPGSGGRVEPDTKGPGGIVGT